LGEIRQNLFDRKATLC